MKPQLLILRDETSAVLIDRRAEVPGFPLMGRLQCGRIELWSAAGRYREDGLDHPLDIVATVVDGVARAFVV